MDIADEIWNRAALNGGGPDPRTGDLALASVLRLHNLAMSSGLLDAVERLPPEQLEAAQAGYHWLHLGQAAELVAMVQQELAAGALNDDARTEALEERADDEYARLVPADQTLIDAFQTRLTEDPDTFNPV